MMESMILSFDNELFGIKKIILANDGKNDQEVIINEDDCGDFGHEDRLQHGLCNCVWLK